jgi:predicted nucleotidyltransferase
MEKFKVKEIGIFGSYARGEEGKRSDVDLLVEFTQPISLIDFMKVENYLTDAIGIKVDLVMKDVLKPRIGRHILSEVVNV